MLDIQLILFVYLAVGAICRRLNIITQKSGAIYQFCSQYYHAMHGI